MAILNLNSIYRQLKVLENEREFIEKYENHRKLFTSYFFLKLEEFMTMKCDYEIAESGKNKKRQQYIQREYYKIDLVGWTQRNPITTNHMNFYDWKLDFALEHENDWKEWVDEVIKLLYIRCPLRVVIGYSNRIDKENLRYDLSNDKKHLNQLEAILNGLYQDGVHFMEQNDEFGIILGNSNPQIFKAADYQLYQIKLKDNKIKIEHNIINELENNQ